MLSQLTHSPRYLRRMPDTECVGEAGRPDASCGFPLGIRGILDFATLLQCFAVLSLGPRSSSSTNPATQNPPAGKSHTFLGPNRGSTQPPTAGRV